MGRKTTLWAFQTSEISHEKTWTLLRKGNLMREIVSFLIVAQNNAIRTNYINARIDKTQYNSKCGLITEADRTNKRKMSTILHMTRWARGSNRNCASN